MSRKKSITIARKPRAQTQPTNPEVLPVGEGALENAGSGRVGVPTETPADNPADASKTYLPSGVFGKTLYGTAYCLSYGVVFGTLVVGVLMPGKRIIARAMTDATDAAKQDFTGLVTRLEKPKRNDGSTWEHRRESPGRAGEDGLIA